MTLGEVVLAPETVGRLRDDIPVLIHSQDTVGRDALDCERPCHAHLTEVFIGLVVQILVVGIGCNGGVNLFLAGNTSLPPPGVEALSPRPAMNLLGIARNLPLLPRYLQVHGSTRSGAVPGPFWAASQITSISELLEMARSSDVRYPLVDKALANIAVA